MKKIAIFSDNLNVGGIQKSLINLLNNYKNKNCEIDLYLFEKSNFFEQQIPKNIKVIYLPKPMFLSKFLYFNIFKILFTSKYKKCIKKYDIAIDFDSYQNHTALCAILTGATSKIMWIHNDVSEKLKGEPKYKVLHHFFKRKYYYFNKFVGVSSGVIEPFQRVNKNIKGNFFIIPNFIDTKEIIEKSKLPLNFQVDSSKYNLVSVGRLCYQKGFDILIYKINELIKYRKDVHLYIIGDGPERNILNNIVKKNKLSDFVTFLGNQKNPFNYMSQMDGFILMSRYEGQGMVILEAKTLGLELFIPKHLEKYVEDVDGYDNIIDPLRETVKKNKKINTLDNYNKAILESIDKLFSL